MEITELLHRVHQGEREALNEAIPLVYAELKKVAANHLRRESGGGRLETTALVHETYMRLVKVSNHPDYENRTHFFAIASRLMRQILVDHARARHSGKREGIEIGIEALNSLGPGSSRTGLLMDLDDALNTLQESDPRKVSLVEMKFFGGMTAEESADALGISPHVARRELRIALAWLHRELSGRGA